MASGLGEYFAEGSVPSAAPPIPQDALPAPPAPMRRSAPIAPLPASGLGEYFSQSGLGVVNLGPVGKPSGIGRMARKMSPMIGALGDATDVVDQTKAGLITGVAAATTLTAILIGIGIRFGSGWLVGKQLAPNAADEKKYAWGGALASVFLGTLGLGATAIVADHSKR